MVLNMVFKVAKLVNLFPFVYDETILIIIIIKYQIPNTKYSIVYKKNKH